MIHKAIRYKAIILLFLIGSLILMMPIVMAQSTNTTNTTVKFRTDPIIVLKPLGNVINKTTDIFVELYMDNPYTNDAILNVVLDVDTPSGIHIYAQEFKDTTSGIQGVFNISPGKSKSLLITIKSENIGNYIAEFSGTYWPGNNKAVSNVISLKHQFKATESSSNPLEPGQLDKGVIDRKTPTMVTSTVPTVTTNNVPTTATPKITANVPGKTPGFSIGMAIFAIYIVLVRKIGMKK